MAGWLWLLLCFSIALSLSTPAISIADERDARPDVCEYAPETCQPDAPTSPPNRQLKSGSIPSAVNAPVPRARPDTDANHQSLFTQCENAIDDSLVKCQAVNTSPPAAPSGSNIKEVCAQASQQFQNKSSEITDVLFHCEGSRHLAYRYCDNLWTARNRLPAAERNLDKPRADAIAQKFKVSDARLEGLRSAQKELQKTSTDYTEKCEKAVSQKPEEKKSEDIPNTNISQANSAKSCEEDPGQSHCFPQLSVSDAAVCARDPSAPGCQSTTALPNNKPNKANIDTDLSPFGPKGANPDEFDETSSGRAKKDFLGIDKSSSSSTSSAANSARTAEAKKIAAKLVEAKANARKTQKNDQPVLSSTEASEKFGGRPPSSWDSWSESENGSFIPPAVGIKPEEEVLDPSIIARPQLADWRSQNKKLAEDWAFIRRQIHPPQVDIFRRIQQVYINNTESNAGTCAQPCLKLFQNEKLPSQAVQQSLDSR